MRWQLVRNCKRHCEVKRAILRSKSCLSELESTMLMSKIGQCLFVALLNKGEFSLRFSTKIIKLNYEFSGKPEATTMIRCTEANCDALFSSFNARTQHVRLDHCLFFCMICANASFKTVEDLDRHTISEHWTLVSNADRAHAQAPRQANDNSQLGESDERRVPELRSAIAATDAAAAAAASATASASARFSSSFSSLPKNAPKSASDSRARALLAGSMPPLNSGNGAWRWKRPRPEPWFEAHKANRCVFWFWSAMHQKKSCNFKNISDYLTLVPI